MQDFAIRETTPDGVDDALRWSREQWAKQIAEDEAHWPGWAADILAGKCDALPGILEHADAYRAGKAVSDARIAKLEAALERIARGEYQPVRMTPNIRDLGHAEARADIACAALESRS